MLDNEGCSLTSGVNVLKKRLQRLRLTLLPCEDIGKKGSL